MQTNLTGSPSLEVRKSRAQRFVEEMMGHAGITVNGSAPWDMQLLADGVCERGLSKGNLGLGETYMDGAWDAPQLDEFFCKLIRGGIADSVHPTALLLHVLAVKLMNRQNKDRAWEVGEKHYDLGNQFYASMLDERMTYTCGYWKDATTLQQAQDAKLDLICRKLNLKPGMRVLDIGCGWGSFMSYAAEHYGVACVGVTISREQAEWGRQRYAHLPIEFRLQDYRDVDEKFDAIASVGMFEHVGPKNYRTYMQTAQRCLKDDGLFLLHTIGKNLTSAPDPWIDKYIFPNGEVPTLAQMTESLEGVFVVEDLHNFGADYDRTLMAWFERFDNAWAQYAAVLGERFYRMWKYYLLSCAGAFRARDLQLWQWVLSPKGAIGGYRRVS